MARLSIILFALVVIWRRADTHDVCMMSALPTLRDAGATYFVATALSDTLVAKVGSGPSHALDILSLSTPPGLQPPPNPKQTVFGQVITLQRVSGSGSAHVQGLLDRGSRQAVVVPWGYQANCSPVLWTDGARWVAVGTDGFYRAQLRPMSEWAAGKPTFDVAAAWHQPYPTGRWVGREGGRNNETEILTPQQLFDLYAVLPDYEGLQRNAREALIPLENWEESNPVLARRWPAWRIGETVRLLARESNH